MQRHRNNTPSETPKDHYKVTVAIPLLDSLIHQMTERFSAEGRHASSLLCLVPSILLCSATDEILSDNLQGMLYWERDLPFPRSLANELGDGMHYGEERKVNDKQVVNAPSL